LLNIPGLYDQKEDIFPVIKDLSFPCYDCRLGHCQKPKQNRGLIWRGNPQAKIALVSIMPGPKEMESGKPLTGKSGQLSDRWFKYLNLDTNKDMFVINVVQCKPPDVEKKGEGGKIETSQREPEQDELAACFPNRCLRILRAMPALEVVVTMGWPAARCILGGDPKDQSHMGHWYTTSLLPGKAVYCLPHPAALLREDKNYDKKYKLIKCLDRFKRQYLDTNKVVGLAQNG
jgi:uracil-DNA glycosylase family 4